MNWCFVNELNEISVSDVCQHFFMILNMHICMLEKPHFDD